tara:strand:- start:1160 stop:2368 length:1209 start_codon:yes stop_codon:yes gene_type:complete
MTILDRAAKLSDEDLKTLVDLVVQNSNKDKRWLAFKSSNLKSKLEDEFSINKADFLITGGLENITRQFVESNDNYIESLNELRNLYLKTSKSVKKSYEKQTNSGRKVSPKIIKWVMRLVFLALAGICFVSYENADLRVQNLILYAGVFFSIACINSTSFFDREAKSYRKGLLGIALVCLGAFFAYKIILSLQIGGFWTQELTTNWSEYIINEDYNSIALKETNVEEAIADKLKQNIIYFQLIAIVFAVLYAVIAIFDKAWRFEPLTLAPLLLIFQGTLHNEPIERFYAKAPDNISDCSKSYGEYSRDSETELVDKWEFDKDGQAEKNLAFEHTDGVKMNLRVDPDKWEICEIGNSAATSIWGAACNEYQICISVVSYNQEGGKGKFNLLSKKEVSDFLNKND